MRIWELLVLHNQPWSRREVICFGMSMAIALLVSLFLLWRKRIVWSQAAAALLLLAFLWVVFESTVFARGSTGSSNYELEFLWSWRAVLRGNRMMLEECLLNLILLLPAGLLFPFVFRLRYPTILGFFLGVIISVSIECLQLFLSRGFFEWDDIFHNSLGYMAGFWAGSQVKKLFYIRQGE